MGQLHAALEMSRRHANKGDAVAMLWVHVGLHLENKARHLFFLG